MRVCIGSWWRIGTFVEAKDINRHTAFVAHVRSADKAKQKVSSHLSSVARISKSLASKVRASTAGELLGLLHDLGKYSAEFQAYIQSATAILNPDIDDEYVDFKSLKGKIDHSSAGAQWIWRQLSRYGENGEGRICGQILALCIASHHSGLIDCLKPDGGNAFSARVNKAEEYTHLNECVQNADAEILERANQLAGPILLKEMLEEIKALMRPSSRVLSSVEQHFYLGLWTRFLFSCLIDADRIDSADFENPTNVQHRLNEKVIWSRAVERVEEFVARLAEQPPEKSSPIDPIRREISERCKYKANAPQGVYTLSVPTGGGKTLASLRYAVHHASKYNLDRIIYVIPYTSIIEQNAKAIRNVLERKEDKNPWVLEHHSNLEPELQTWKSKIAAENWDSPVILTTMVQFLETLFSGGTSGVRRLHQLANSVIIFDEVQSLPISCTHMFCNAINFLTKFSGTTAVLCTATQPVLNKLKAPGKGQLWLSNESELIQDTTVFFEQLKRVNVLDKTSSSGWSKSEIASLAIEEMQQKGSCLVIVNTKSWAKDLYLECGQFTSNEALFHLSTAQCPFHRKEILDRIKQRLEDGSQVLCISTQLIEAGVDVDFASVIRFIAGMDSIAQAAGRCNRNGRMKTGEVHVVNPDNEVINQLVDIKVGQEKTRRIFAEFKGQDLLQQEVMTRYFQYYFFDRADQMTYPISAKNVGRSDSLLNLLSENKLNTGRGAPIHLKQSFMTAGSIFKAIDAPTYSAIVPYKDGKNLIEELGGMSVQFDSSAYRQCLRNAQRYSVSVFTNVWQALLKQGAVWEIQSGEGVYCLDERYYSVEFGLSTEPQGRADAQIH